MKVKGISTVELHAEKILLAVVALVLLAVIAMQFVGGGNTIKLDKDAAIPIDQAYGRLAREAEAHRGRMADTAVDPQALQPVPDAAVEFAAKLRAAQQQAMVLKGPLGPGRGATSDSPGPTSTGDALRVALPKVGAPSAPRAAGFAGTLDPVLVAVTPALASMAPSLPAQQPYDIRSVTVEATFDASALVAAMRLDPDGAGPMQAVPEVWWQSALDVLDVELWRQEILPDGSMSGEQLIPPLPGRFSLRDKLDHVADARELRAGIATQARENQTEIVRPRFLRTISGQAWAPPAAPTEAGDKFAEVERLRRQYHEAVRKIEDLNRELSPNKPGATKPTPARAPGVRNGASDGGTRAQGRPGGIGSPARPSDRPPSQPSSGTDPEQARRESIQKQIATWTTRRDEYAKRLADLGAPVTGAPAAGAAAQPATADEPVRPLKEGGALRLWAHDITAKAGATYRYKLRLVLPNPLFGTGPTLADESRALADAPVLKSADSAWSEPVTVDPEMYLFITDARRGATLGAGVAQASAAAEVFRFYYGYWRSASVQLSPGDAVAGQAALKAALPIYTIETGASGPMVSGSTPVSGPIDVAAAGWYLVDVSPAAGPDGPAQAVMSDPSGQLVLRDPRADTAGDRLRRLRQNAEAGQSATTLPPGDGVASAPAPVAGGDDRQPPQQPDRSAPSERRGLPGSLGGGPG